MQRKDVCIWRALPYLNGAPPKVIADLYPRKTVYIRVAVYGPGYKVIVLDALAAAIAERVFGIADSSVLLQSDWEQAAFYSTLRDAWHDNPERAMELFEAWGGGYTSMRWDHLLSLIAVANGKSVDWLNA